MLILTILSSTATADTEAVIDGLLSRMESAAASLVDATFLLHREEWKDGRMLPAQDIEVKYRRGPESLYFHWVGDVHKGREVIWERNRNDGQLLVNAGALVPNLTLDPLGSVAMRDSRNPVWMAELTRIADMVLAGARLLKSRDDLTAEYTDLGSVDALGTPSRCYKAKLPYEANPAVLYAPEIRLCLDTQTWLPSRFTAWMNEDGAYRQVEDYAFRQQRINVGLTDADFDADNPSYGF